MAACVAQGALALFGLDTAGRRPCGRSTCSPSDEARQVAELGFPARFRALLGLTAGERRVLFYLTEGWAAQDIADELVVSLTTVRSHIRSVLRKLEVRSQLAAVAIANSRDLDHRARRTPEVGRPGSGVSRPGSGLRRRDAGGGQAVQQLVLRLEHGSAGDRPGPGSSRSGGRSPGPGDGRGGGRAGPPGRRGPAAKDSVKNTAEHEAIRSTASDTSSAVEKVWSWLSR